MEPEFNKDLFRYLKWKVDAGVKIEILSYIKSFSYEKVTNYETYYIQDNLQTAQLTIRKAEVTLLAPWNGNLSNFFNTLNQDQFSKEWDLQLSPNIISPFYYRMLDHESVHSILNMNFTKEDKETMKLIYANNFYIFPGGPNNLFKLMYFALNYNDFKNSEARSDDYKSIFNAIYCFAKQEILLERFEINLPIKSFTGRLDIIHRVIQNDGYTLPKYKKKIIISTSWEEIYAIARKRFLIDEEYLIILEKIQFEWRSKCNLDELWFRSLNDLMDKIQERLPEQELNQLMMFLDDIYLSLEEIVSIIFKNVRQEKLSKLSSLTCRICKVEKATNRIPWSIITAFKGEIPQLCDFCKDTIFDLHPDLLLKKRAGNIKISVEDKKHELLELVRGISIQTGVVPPSEPIKYLSRVDVKHHMDVLDFLNKLPDRQLRKKIFPRGWSQVLAEANLVETEKNTGFGFQCIAEDGHLCRSLSEKFIDDWLYKNGLQHECEPAYPIDEFLNPNGMRADFKVGDVWIEFFGLYSKSYLNKIDVKLKLAKKHSLNLIPLYPEDLTEVNLANKLNPIVRDYKRSNK